MKFFRRSSTDSEGDVRWLAPTRLRQPKRRFLPLALFGFLLLAASAGVIAYVALGPRSATAPQEKLATSAPATPAPSSAQVEPTRPPPPPEPQVQANVQEAPPPPDPSPVRPLPPPVAEPPVASAPASPSPAEEASPSAPSSPVAGAFPAPSAEAGDDPEAPNFAVYLNEAAPDEAGARALLLEAQRRYAGALEGGRLSYRRVRVGDGYAWRLRLSGLTRARAQETCQALTGLGAECEVGPR